VLIYLLAGGLAFGQVAEDTEAGGLKGPARLVPSVTAVAPGGSFDVGVAYGLVGDWHIFWKNPGGRGAAPQAQWQLPAGFKVGELRFPTPRRHQAGPEDRPITTYVHWGEPVLLARVTAPDDLEPGSEVTIGAKLVTVVCDDQCATETQDLSLTLPVVANAAAVKPANKELLDDAADEIPPADGKGKFVSVTAKPSVESVGIGGQFDVTVTIDIKRGFHIQSNKPYIAGLIPTEVVVEPTPGVELGGFTYPPAKERVDRVLRMKLSEFAGRPVVKVPVSRVTGDATGAELTLRGIVIAQACDEKSGRCFPPEAVGWTVTVGLTGAGTEAVPVEAGADEPSEEPAEAAVAEAEQPGGDEPAEDEALSLPLILLFAFLGGVILNVMPCVWPVISIKILSFVQQAHDDPKRALRLGLLFGLGILVSFWLLGVAAVVAKTAAGGATWGTQFQNPTFVIAMIAILWVFGLSLFGIFEINLPGAAAGKLSAATAREGYAGSFVKGMLATVLATPCTAPFLGTAVAVAYGQSAVVIMLAMTAIGLGMGLPYTILSANPGWLKFLPKPGPWMETFKQFTGFLLVGVVIWLLWVLGKLQGADGIVATVVFMTALGVAAWVYGKMGLTWSSVAKLTGTLGVVVIAVVGGWFAYVYLPALAGEIDWVAHEPGLHKELAAEGHTVFVNYTAAWCTKCILEKKTVIETDAVRRKLRDLQVVPIKADFTNRQAWITKELKSYGRAGVPLDVVVPAGQPDNPIVLPEIMTQSMLLEALDRAGPSTAEVAPGAASSP
jgi:thiol:disulfide interchange protein DsbD